MGREGHVDPRWRLRRRAAFNGSVGCVGLREVLFGLMFALCVSGFLLCVLSVWWCVLLVLSSYVLLVPVTSFKGYNYVSGVVCVVLSWAFGFGRQVVGMSPVCGMGVSVLMFLSGPGWRGFYRLVSVDSRLLSASSKPPTLLCLL